MTRTEARPPRRDALPVVERLLLGTLFLAAVVLLSFPAARGAGQMLGWTPFWLLALPATSLLATRLLAWSRRGVATGAAVALPSRRRAPAIPGARRRAMPRRQAARALAAIALR
ncbi:hypothetical protein FZO89_07050 [Luteimonas viscosa]|uniref:Uncharacterized protein n=1 Tax=Luteimonas viscosa TaxID=1132694 RepID=A0A5D4XN85_9GAMM|nr:hypothetical protein [Luteimonas viscosa]TYT26029.1 hypothetical protein FZO89_07050 [Luteimonas viscosa]